MFNFLKKDQKSHFEIYYNKLISQEIIKQSQHHKPVTASMLFIMSDLIFAEKYDPQKRKENAQQIFSILEKKYLSSDEMLIFDKCTNLFGQVIRGEIDPHGFWCLHDIEDPECFDRLFLCYGDLISDPSNIDDYENAPVLIHDIFTQMSFVQKFNKLTVLLDEYTEGLLPK